MVDASDLTDILRTKHYVRDLSIKFSVVVPYFCKDIQQGFSICRLLNKVFDNPSAALLDPLRSGALRSIELSPRPHPPPPHCRTERFIILGMRRSPIWLSKKDEDLVVGCLTYLQQEAAAFLVNASILASVHDKRGAFSRKWVGCEETRRLVRER